jgi:hypothetical protein
MKSFEVFVWASNYEDFTGEGLLARLFVKKYFFSYKGKIRIFTNESNYNFYQNKNYTNVKKKYKNNFFKKYLYTFYGIILIWYFYLNGKKVCYINYLPLWAFWIFLLLPKKTIIGPVTGAVYKKNIYTLNNLIRRFIIPFFYFLTLQFIFAKFEKIIFSTDKLKGLIPRSKIQYCIFNFCLLFYKKRIYKKKNIDFLFYLRLHANKSNSFHKKIIDLLSNLNFKIIVVGDKFLKSNVKNYINIPREKLLKLLDKTKFTIISDENFYSLFAIDCFSSNVHVFYDKNSKPSKFYFSKELAIDINFSNINYSIKKIINFTKKYKQKSKRNILNNNLLYIKNLNKKFKFYSNEI